MNILGNIGPSTGGPYEINWNAILKTFRMALVVGAGGIAGYLVTGLPLLDWMPNSELDVMVNSAVIIPLLELVRRWATDYSK